MHLQEGQSETAKLNAHANDDGVIDKEEQKRIDRAHKKALEQRLVSLVPLFIHSAYNAKSAIVALSHRGKMQFAPVRSAVWAKDGMKDRLRKIGNKMTGKSEREDDFGTEA